MELREKIAAIVGDVCWVRDSNGNCHTNIVGADTAADAILAIPEIRDALIACGRIDNPTKVYYRPGV